MTGSRNERELANAAEPTEVELHFLEAHPRQHDIEAIVASCIDNLLMLTENDQELVARIHATVGVILYYQCRQLTLENKSKSRPEEIEAATLVQKIGELSDSVRASRLEEASQDELEHPQEPSTASQVLRNFSQGLGARIIYRLQGQEGLRGDGAVTAENLVESLLEYGEAIREAESALLSKAADEGISIVASWKEWETNDSPREYKAERERAIFMDPNIYNGYYWNAIAHDFISKCARDFDSARAANLNNELARFSRYFRQMFPEILAALPGRIERIQEDLESALLGGLTTAEAREFGRAHGVETLGIVMKTWLDQLSAEKKVRKGEKNGKVAYFKPQP